MSMSNEPSNDEPISPRHNPLTYNESHTIILGMLGALASIAVHLNWVTLAVLGSGFLLAIVFGVEERYLRLLGERGERAINTCRSSKARRLLRIEPWYFIGTFLASGTGTYLVIEFALGGFGA